MYLVCYVTKHTDTNKDCGYVAAVQCCSVQSFLAGAYSQVHVKKKK